MYLPLMQLKKSSSQVRFSLHITYSVSAELAGRHQQFFHALWERKKKSEEAHIPPTGVQCELQRNNQLAEKIVCILVIIRSVVGLYCENNNTRL